jgi:hypothetical protein
VFVVSEQVAFAVRCPDLEILCVGFLLAIFYRSDAVGLVVEMKPDRSLVGFVTREGVDIDLKGHCGSLA